MTQLTTVEDLIETLNADPELRGGVTRLSETSDNVIVRLDNLKAMVWGEQLERKAFNVVPGRLGKVTNKRIRRIEPMLTQSGAIFHKMQYLYPVQDALADGNISDSEYDRLMRTDLIFRASFRQTLHLFPVEVSRTIAKDDVDRVARSANILKKIYDAAETIPIVAGAFISGWLRDHAERVGVKVVTFAFDDSERSEQT